MNSTHCSDGSGNRMGKEKERGVLTMGYFTIPLFTASAFNFWLAWAIFLRISFSWLFSTISWPSQIQESIFFAQPYLLRAFKGSVKNSVVLFYDTGLEGIGYDWWYYSAPRTDATSPRVMIFAPKPFCGIGFDYWGGPPIRPASFLLTWRSHARSLRCAWRGQPTCLERRQALLVSF